jgi:lipopolysaccharide biosynthesis regulator YciM
VKLFFNSTDEIGVLNKFNKSEIKTVDVHTLPENEKIIDCIAQGKRVNATKLLYVCKNCGMESKKWLGQCPECKSWNSLSVAGQPADISYSPFINRMKEWFGEFF